MNRKIKNCIYMGMCLIFAYWVLIVLGENGPIIEADSMTFLNPTEYVKKSYPLYTIFLRLCEVFWGKDKYLYAVHIIQSVLIFCVSWYWSSYLKKFFELNYLFSFGVYICTFLPYGYSLPESVVSHHILTEGLAFPIFLMYMLFIIRAFLENKKRYLVMAGLTVILLFMTRSQMMLLLPVYVFLWGIFLVWNFCLKIEKKYCKIVLQGLVGVVTVGFIVFFFVLGKMPEVLGWNQLTDAVMGRVLCAIDEDDKLLFHEDEREVFELLYSKIEQNQNRYPYFRDGIWKWEDIMVATNENTLMYRKTVHQYYEDSGSIAVETDVKRSISLILSKLYYEHLDDYVSMSLHLFAQSFVVAVFIHPTPIFVICYIIAFMIYIVSTVMIWYSICKKNIDGRYVIPLVLSLLMICAIVIITNIVFYGLQRYVVYVFGSFYASCLVLVCGIIRERKRYI